MFLSKNRRARVVAAALAVVLLVPLATTSADYWEGGARANSNPINGYILEFSAENSEVAFYVQEAYRNWKGYNTSVTFGIYDSVVWSPRVDRVAYLPFYKTGSYPNQTALGITQLLIVGQNGNYIEAARKYPKTYRDESWGLCRITLYERGIYWSMRSHATSFAATAEGIMTHEVGHSLKMAHHKQAGVRANGEGTGAGRNVFFTAGYPRSIMERPRKRPYVREVQEYDIRNLRAKWVSF